MSVGGPFNLITSTGLQDRLLMATDTLMERVRNISKQRLASLREEYPNLTDVQLEKKPSSWLPMLKEIEKSHIVFINATYKPFVAMAHEYSKTHPCQGIPKLGGTFSFTLPHLGEFVNDAVMYVKLTGLSAVHAADKVRYVEFLAHRMMKRVSFKIQNHELDSYTSDQYNIHYQYKVPQHKEAGYLRNIGQEVPKQAFLTADPAVDEVREYRYFGNGPQTFKNVQPDVEMWIPILFWFKNIETSLPNFLLPKNQVNIEVTLEDAANLVAYAIYSSSDGAYNAPTISECSLYLNHIYLLPEIYKIFMHKFGFHLIRVHRYHTEILADSEKRIRLHALKWPMETIYVAFRPRVNLTSSQNWHRPMQLTARTYKEAVVVGTSTIQVNEAVYYNEKHCITKMELRSNDIVIYPELAPEFYDSYLPYRYGVHLKTPKQLGWYMINFCMNPGEHQPSGHMNATNNRELDLRYVSAVDDSDNYIIRPDNPVDLIVSADVINFLIVHNGTAALRFAT